MICHQVQSNLSLYLYGELEFAVEESLEQHLHECAFCQQALAREKSWHANVNSGQASVPLELLAQCRVELREQVAKSANAEHRTWRSALRQWWEGVYMISSAWPARVSAAILLLVMGFGAGRWADRKGFSPETWGFSPAVQAGTLAPFIRVRNIEPGEDGRLHMLVEHVEQRELTGSAADGQIRQALLIAASNATDPAVRVDSLEYLRGQTGSDVRDALLVCLRKDHNAAVRLKALEGLRPFVHQPETRHALVDVLEHDENAGVRADAIDVLLPPKPVLDVSPELVRTLQGIVAARADNDYVHTRCQQALQTAGAAAPIY